jgi:hypothetical protein
LIAVSSLSIFPGSQWRSEQGISMSRKAAIIGVAHHNGWAVFVTVASDGTLLDRRRVELVDADLPCMPHHGPGQRLPLEQAVDLVERVRVSANRQAELALDATSAAVRAPIHGVALRECPRLPTTTAERIQDYWAQCNADSVMYRKALARAAESRGWTVHWYDKKKVEDAARDVLDIEDFKAHFLGLRKSMGPPWREDHKIAMAAGIVAGASAVSE